MLEQAMASAGEFAVLRQPLAVACTHIFSSLISE